MAWRLSRTITTVLAISFTTAVHGANECLTTECTAGSTEPYFGGTDCILTDNDIDELKTCFELIGPSNIERLSIVYAEFTTLPSDLFEGMTNVYELSFLGSTLTTFDAAMFQPMASTLTNLELNGNDLATLPSSVFAGMGALESLRLNGNQLATLPSGLFGDLANLEKLYLQTNELTALGFDLFQGLSSLTILFLSENPLTTLPSGVFAGLESLQTLSMYFCELTALEADLFEDLANLQTLSLGNNKITALPSGGFAGTGSLYSVDLTSNDIVTPPSDAFEGLGNLQAMYLGYNDMMTLPSDIFAGMRSLKILNMVNNGLTALPSGIFAGLESLETLSVASNQLTTLPLGVFAGLGGLQKLYLNKNDLNALDVDVFDDLASANTVNLAYNDLTTLPAGVFENLGSDTSLEFLILSGNAELQCIPANSASGSSSTFSNSGYNGQDITMASVCECTNADVVACDVDQICNDGAEGYTCDAGIACEEDAECDTAAGEECCPLKLICEVPDATDPGACGDPHMTGFRGQKFDFTGEDGGWYAVVSDLPEMHLNMRVTAPVPSLPEITYITGISVSTTDADGVDHSIVISVKDPHSMDSGCPTGMTFCLADGALHVVVDGEEVMLTPDAVTIAPDVAMAAVNLPGACRSFGFEQYWERKKLEYLAQPDRKLDLVKGLQDMSDWVLADPTATNMVECAEYVGRVTAAGDVGLFDHQSEHVSFQIMTPTTTIRLSHGRLHQLPMRDPTDQYDLPDHLAWQMNVAIDHSDMSLDATGVLGETLVLTHDEAGAPIMHGMGAIRGAQEDYRVSGPLGVFFTQDKHHDD